MENQQLMTFLGNLIESISTLATVVAKQQNELAQMRDEETSENLAITSLMPNVEALKAQLTQMQSGSPTAELS